MTSRETKQSSENTNANYISSLIDGYRHSKVLFTAVEFKLFDHLVNQSLTSIELATKLNLSHLLAFERFLNACVALQLLEHDKTTKKYSNTKLSEKYLVSTSPSTLNGYINHNNQSSYLLWNTLGDAIRENKPQWQHAFNTGKGDIFTFDSHYRDENAETLFISGMHGLGLTSFPNIVKYFDNLKQFKTLCDLGGATGCLAISACEVNSQLQAIIFDLPRIEKHTNRCIDQTSSDIRSRIRFQSGDFFVDALPHVDLFGLGRILHDWTDEQCEHLLTKIYQTLPENNGAVLIAEKLLDDNKTGPLDVNIQDLNMLIATTGRERSCIEYQAMLEKIGFKNIQFYRSDSYLDGILGYK
ncbi:hypothetical protein I4U23_014124 [Adineta vaga]|nr:hypothetical protein I4U23_014124 [Adineta vaga]